MFKKFSLSLWVVLVLLASLSVPVFAQSTRPPADSGSPVQNDGGLKGAALEAAADVLGMSMEELKAYLKTGEPLADLAEQKGISLDTLTDAVTAPLAERLTQAVANGKISQDRADLILQKARVRFETFASRGMPQLQSASLLAGALGMTPQELRQATQEGKTVAQLAEEKNISLDTLAGIVIQPQTDRINEQVEAGKITREQADLRIAALKEKALQRLASGKGVKNRPNFDQLSPKR